MPFYWETEVGSSNDDFVRAGIQGEMQCTETVNVVCLQPLHECRRRNQNILTILGDISDSVTRFTAT
jgi:hypothetical protein